MYQSTLKYNLAAYDDHNGNPGIWLINKNNGIDRKMWLATHMCRRAKLIASIECTL